MKIPKHTRTVFTIYYRLGKPGWTPTEIRQKKRGRPLRVEKPNVEKTCVEISGETFELQTTKEGLIDFPKTIPLEKVIKLTGMEILEREHKGKYY